jgi:hypothetical protein
MYCTKVHAVMLSVCLAALKDSATVAVAEMSTCIPQTQTVRNVHRGAQCEAVAVMRSSRGSGSPYLHLTRPPEPGTPHPQDNISSGRAGEGMLTLQHLHNPAEAAAASGGGQAELLDRLDCGVKILSGELITSIFQDCIRQTNSTTVASCTRQRLCAANRIYPAAACWLCCG